MRRLLVVAIALSTLAAAAQEAGTKFSSATITKAPSFEAKEGKYFLSGGVEIVLTPEDPKEEPLTIRAEEITLVQGEGEDAGWSKAELRRNVYVKGLIGTISSDSADLDQANDSLIFRGNVSVDSPEIRNGRATELSADLATGNIKGKNLTMDVPFGNRGGSSTSSAKDPMLLTQGDIVNWQGLLDKVKAQASADAPSPGKRIAALLSDEARAFLMQLPAGQAPADELKSNILKQFNSVLQRKDFHDAASWKGIKLDEQTTTLIQKKPASAAEVSELNRRLLEAAYPDDIARKATR